MDGPADAEGTVAVTAAASRSETPAANVRESGDGTPLLLLHGWGASADLFAPLVAPLQSGRRLILPDLPGFGATAAPSQPWSVTDYAEWTRALLTRLDIARCDIIGHSNGARIAMKLAATRPEMVGKMVLTGAAGIRRRHGLAYHARVRSYKALRRLSTARMLPEAARRWAGRRAARRGSADYQAASGAMRGTLVRLVNEDLRPILGRISSPVLLIWGEHDPETPLSDGRLLERLIPDAGLVVFEGSGHYAYLEHPARFCRIVDVFLGAA